MSQNKLQANWPGDIVSQLITFNYFVIRFPEKTQLVDSYTWRILKDNTQETKFDYILILLRISKS